ncbi:hypothetical protein HELRODRAFT_179638 [Helobdella robusta]|uniref:Uncharacterized protein n=1 Tax=Helobdella robusta TaxID=6412 RepID=T1FEZ0_HELRO|nr:hypothetical protein HELRODRAFT_179638 [Helobdella robusta]ESN95292.1 hypothetical protein HELRODRAFT_179638 [Helobdella robusta]
MSLYSSSNDEDMNSIEESKSIDDSTFNTSSMMASSLAQKSSNADHIHSAFDYFEVSSKNIEMQSLSRSEDNHCRSNTNEDDDYNDNADSYKNTSYYHHCYKNGDKLLNDNYHASSSSYHNRSINEAKLLYHRYNSNTNDNDDVAPNDADGDDELRHVIVDDTCRSISYNSTKTTNAFRQGSFNQTAYSANSKNAISDTITFFGPPRHDFDETLLEDLEKAEELIRSDWGNCI